MDEEQLKALLGDNFDGAKDFFKNQVLGNGDYVNKGKAEAEKAELEKQLAAANERIKSTMTDDEKAKAAEKANLKLIEDLKAQLLQKTLEGNQSKALGNMSESLLFTDIKKDDAEFSKFIENISFEDAEKTVETSQYVSKLIKDAYEKGKAEATKQNLARIGGFNANGSNGSDSENKGESIGERLAKQNTTTVKKSSYFKN